MTENVFDQNTPPPVAPIVSSDPFADQLKEIVNDAGQPKYKDTKAALDALKASQDHIKRLEDEAKTRQAEEEKLREAAVRAEALEDIVTRLTNNSKNTPPKEQTPPNAGMNEEATIKLLEGVLSKREQATVHATNLQAVSNAMIAKFGDKEKAQAALNARAGELGMTVDGLQAISRENPRAALTLLGLTEAAKTASPTVPSVTPMTVPKTSKEVAKPERSLISGPGATDAARKAKMAEIREAVYARYNVEV